MDLFMTFSDFMPARIIENYQSLIWTERYSEYGDFTLVVKESDILMGPLRAYKFLLSSESDRVMMIESIETTGHADGEDVITLKGRSIEAVLDYRSSEIRNTDEWIRTGSAGELCTLLVDWYVVNPSDPRDKIDRLSIENTHPTNPYMTFQNKRDTVYKVVKNLCDSAGLGFRIRRDPTSGNLIFGVYEGLDRTNLDSVAYRIFSEDTDNLVNSKLTASISNYKNHARIIGKRTTTEVYAPGTSSQVSGIDKRTLVVQATDVGEEGRPLDEDREILQQRGLEALAEETNREVRMIDGDVPPNRWDRGTGLGSMVFVKDNYGYEVRARVTEEILSIDSEGLRIIPTFAQF